MCLQYSYSGHLKLIWDRMVPSCLQKQGHGASLAAGAGARQLTLQEILYPPPSWEMEGIGATPARRNSPKVCPVNLDSSSEYSEGGDPDSPAVNESVSISRASLRSQNTVSRRV